MANGVLVAGSVAFDTPWLTDQNLATALSRTTRVLYVEPPISPLTPFRSTGTGGQPLRQQLGSLIGQRPRHRGDVVVTRPVAVPPLEHRVSRRMSAPLIRAQLRRSIRAAGDPYGAVLLARRLPLPPSDSVVCHLVKDWTPAGADLVGRDREDLVREIVELAGSADIVVAISKALQTKLAEHGIESHLLRHGFHARLAERYDTATLPAELAALPSPRLLYAGRIDARLDLGMLDRLAARFRSGSVVFVGPASPRLPDEPQVRKLFARPNVHRLGSRDRLALPAYLVHADCLLLPYARREWLRFGSPLKLWDYLYAGPPLVGSGCTVLAEYPPPLVDFVEDNDEFPERVERALSEPRSGAAQRRAFALANTWDHRADELLSLLSL